MSSEASEVDGLVSFTVVVGKVIVCARKCMVVLDRLRVSYSRLVLEDTEDLIVREPQRGEVLFHFEGSK